MNTLQSNKQSRVQTYLKIRHKGARPLHPQMILSRFRRVFLCTFVLIHWHNKKRVTGLKIGNFSINHLNIISYEKFYYLPQWGESVLYLL